MTRDDPGKWWGKVLQGSLSVGSKRTSATYIISSIFSAFRLKNVFCFWTLLVSLYSAADSVDRLWRDLPPTTSMRNNGIKFCRVASGQEFFLVLLPLILFHPCTQKAVAESCASNRGKARLRSDQLT